MNLSIRQYALLFAFLTVCMVSFFSWTAYRQFDETRQHIIQTQQNAALNELTHKASQVSALIREKARVFAQWEEIHQQLANPNYFAYWYNVRLKQTHHALEDFISDLMVYDTYGKALAQLSDNSLSKELANLPDSGVYTIDSIEDQIYTLPILDTTNNSTKGYLSIRLDLVSTLQKFADFYNVDADSLQIMPDKVKLDLQHIDETIFNFTVIKTPEIKILEDQLESSIFNMTLLVTVPALFLYFLLVYIISVPIKSISDFILQLRTIKDPENCAIQTNFFQVSELNNVCNSLIHYHLDLHNTHAVLDQKNKALWEQAHHDALTGVYNRRAFDDQWKNLKELLSEQRVKVSFILFDINLFKTINDTHGHQVGDEVLKGITHCINKSLRHGEHLFRLGGDEFATFQIDTSADNACMIAQRCIDEIKNYDFKSVGMPEPVRVSIGISEARGGSEDAFNDMHWQADAAMYAAKRPGSEDIVIYSEDITQGSKGLLSSWLSNTVYQAIDQGTGLVLFYQPIVDFNTGKISYYEALVRIYAQNELIMPGNIFNVVEARRFETELDFAVIRQLLKDLEKGVIPEGTGVSLNLSGQSLGYSKVTEWVQPLQKYNKKYKIVLEVTETALIAELNKATQYLNQMRDMGFIIALDDFGSGYSSVKYLASMPVDVVKFDITIIHSMLDQEQRIMIARLAEMINEAGHKLVAEGIEDFELLQIVQQTGFHFGQGFLFGRAEQQPAQLDAEKFTRYLPAPG